MRTRRLPLSAKRPSPWRSYATGRAPRSVPILPDSDLTTFRDQAFVPAVPYLLPRGTFRELPAIDRWFFHATRKPSKSTSQPFNPLRRSLDLSNDDHTRDPSVTRSRTTLNREYFLPFGPSPVPLEILNAHQFCRIDSTLSFFLECTHASSSKYLATPHRYFSSYIPGARAVHRTTSSNDFFTRKPVARVYLAQAPIADLPRALRLDLPVPDLVTKVGRGDVYDSSIWLGEAPTYTPLHRDPNPNLLVQLAGQKIVRLLPPEIGRRVFARVQDEIGGAGRANLRGEEMMQGPEREVLEKAIWDDGKGIGLEVEDGGDENIKKKKEDEEGGEDRGKMLQAKLYSGDALFIPKGWWHSVKGVGQGMTGSVNWWFR